MRKRIITVIVFLLIALLLATVFSSCSSVSVDYSSATKNAANETLLDGELKDFLAVNGGNRTSQTRESGRDASDGEKIAADYICEKLNEYAGAGKAEIKEFTATSSYGDVFTSQNIVLSIKAPSGKNTGGKKIVIGSAYDNSYESIEVIKQESLLPIVNRNTNYYIFGTNAEGVVESGLSAAVLLDAARRICENADSLTQDVDIVFYGLGAISLYGSYKYSESLNKEKVSLVFNISHLGGDNLYAYYDEVQTRHGAYLNGILDDIGYGGYITEKRTDTAKYLGDSTYLPYTPGTLNNDSSTYFADCNICSITSGAGKNPFFLLENESEVHENMLGTSSDNYKYLSQNNPEFLTQMDMVSTFLLAAVCDDGLSGACAESLAEKYDYSFISSTLWMNVISIGTGVLFIVLLIVAVKILEKKYPRPEPPKPKMSNVFDESFVFGNDEKTDSGSAEPEDVDPFGDFGES